MDSFLYKNFKDKRVLRTERAASIVFVVTIILVCISLYSTRLLWNSTFFYWNQVSISQDQIVAFPNNGSAAALSLKLCNLDNLCKTIWIAEGNTVVELTSETLREYQLCRQLSYFKVSIPSTNFKARAVVVTLFMDSQQVFEGDEISSGSGVEKSFVIPVVGNKGYLEWVEMIPKSLGYLVDRVSLVQGLESYELLTSIDVVVWNRIDLCPDYQISLAIGTYDRRYLMSKYWSLFFSMHTVRIPANLFIVLYDEQEGEVDIGKNHKILEVGQHDWLPLSSGNWNRLMVMSRSELASFLQTLSQDSELLTYTFPQQLEKVPLKDIAVSLSDEKIYLHSPQKPIQPQSKIDVTLVTQFSINRLERFKKAVANWPGPVSAAVYLTHPWDTFLILDRLIKSNHSLIFENVTFVILKPDFRGNYRHYPINRLRNLAIKTVQTSHYLMIDTDFIPNEGLYVKEKLRLRQWHERYNVGVEMADSIDANRDFLLMNEQESLNWAMDWNIRILQRSQRKDYNYAFVVPCFALRVSYGGEYPRQMSDVKRLFRDDHAYITDSVVGHGITGFGIFSENIISSFLNFDPVGGRNVPLSTVDYFHVCFENQWEPYYILPTFTSPLYDERFRNQGGDKQSHALFLNACNYIFLVLRESFIFHLDHTPDLIWPGESFQRKSKSLFTENYKDTSDETKISGSTAATSRFEGCSWPDLVDMEEDQRRMQKHRLWLGSRGQIDFFADYIGWLNDAKYNSKSTNNNGSSKTSILDKLDRLFHDVRFNGHTCPSNPLLKMEQRFLLSPTL